MDKITPDIRHALTLFLVLLLSACPGGGADNEKGNAQLTSTEDVNIKSISGIFNTSKTNDKAYLYIAEDGSVISYDDQQDAAGSGSNCYKETSSNNQINHIFSRGEITYESSTKLYTIKKTTNTLTFSYTDTDGIRNLIFNGSSYINGIDNPSPQNIKIDNGAKKDPTITIEIITSNICT